VISDSLGGCCLSACLQALGSLPWVVLVIEGNHSPLHWGVRRPPGLSVWAVTGRRAATRVLPPKQTHIRSLNCFRLCPYLKVRSPVVAPFEGLAALRPLAPAFGAFGRGTKSCCFGGRHRWALWMVGLAPPLHAGYRGHAPAGRRLGAIWSRDSSSRRVHAARSTWARPRYSAVADRLLGN
jgi:hypothetical protein